SGQTEAIVAAGVDERAGDAVSDGPAGPWLGSIGQRARRGWRPDHSCRFAVFLEFLVAVAEAFQAAIGMRDRFGQHTTDNELSHQLVVGRIVWGQLAAWHPV